MSPVEPVWSRISRFGKKIVNSGLTSSRFGNISVLEGESILITCTGSMLDELDEASIVRIDRADPCEMDRIASSEAGLHRAVYKRTGHLSVVHTHSPYAVVCSLLETEMMMPIDGEGRAFLGAVPIVEGSFGSEELALAVSGALVAHKACIARGHGVFAAGSDLSDAYTVACMAEHSSMVRRRR